MALLKGIMHALCVTTIHVHFISRGPIEGCSNCHQCSLFRHCVQSSLQHVCLSQRHVLSISLEPLEGIWNNSNNHEDDDDDDLNLSQEVTHLTSQSSIRASNVITWDCFKVKVTLCGQLSFSPMSNVIELMTDNHRGVESYFLFLNIHVVWECFTAALVQSHILNLLVNVWVSMWKDIITTDLNVTD